MFDGSSEFRGEFSLHTTHNRVLAVGSDSVVDLRLAFDCGIFRCHVFRLAAQRVGGSAALRKRDGSAARAGARLLRVPMAPVGSRACGSVLFREFWDTAFSGYNTSV